MQKELPCPDHRIINSGYLVTCSIMAIKACKNDKANVTKYDHVPKDISMSGSESCSSFSIKQTVRVKLDKKFQFPPPVTSSANACNQ
jgi:hypothetical protein